MTTRIKGLLLIGLFLIWGTTMFLDNLEDSEPQRVPLTYRTGQTIGSMGKGQHQLLALKNPASGKSASATFTQPRNIFAPLQFSPPPSLTPPPSPDDRPTPPMPPSGRNSSVGHLKPSSRPSPADMAAQRARQQLNQYRFLGYLKKEGKNRVFLSNGQAIYIVTQGETVEGDITVRAIEPTSVILSKRVPETGDTVEATLPLTKEKSERS